MTDRPRISDESVLTRWMTLEISKINRDVVTTRKPLAELAGMDPPVLQTKGGGQYRFNKETLLALRKTLPEDLSRHLLLPVLCYFDSAVGDSCFITDSYAADALKILGEISDMREMADGRLWIGKTIVFAVMRKYPSIIQIVMR